MHHRLSSLLPLSISAPLADERIERLLHVGYWHLRLEDDYLYWSDEIYTIYGEDRNSFTPTIENAVDAFMADDQPEITDILERAIEKGEHYAFIARLIHSSGAIRIVLARGESERDDEGKITAIFGTFQDITEYIEEQERYERTALGSGIVIWDWDMVNDRIHWLGHSYRALGFVDQNHAPRNAEEFFKKLIPPDYELPFKHAVDTHLKEKTLLALNMQITKVDGSAIWVIVRAQAQWNIHGEAVRLSGSFTDIDVLKKTEDKLLRSNSDLEQFASVAAHDLQAPLRTISGFIDIVEKEEGENLSAKSLEYLRTSKESAQSMSELVSDLLEYSRLETEGIEKHSVNATKIIQEAIRPIKHIILETGASVEFDNMPEIMCDRHKMQRVFTNLIENALKYRKKDGPAPHIKIIAEKIDGLHIFKITDNGIGMEPRNLERIFMMFSRLHHKDDYGGTGIGLSICKKVLDLHEGHIRAESTFGEGSTFILEIPA